MLFHVARDQATTTEWARAEANYTESIRLATETGQTTELAMSLAGLCWLESRAGKAEACRTHAAEARALCTARDIHIGEAWVEYALGDLDLSLGHADLAARPLSELIASWSDSQLEDVDLAPAPELADALMRLGRRSEARIVARAAIASTAITKGQPWALARGRPRVRAGGRATMTFDELVRVRPRPGTSRPWTGSRSARTSPRVRVSGCAEPVGGSTPAGGSVRGVGHLRRPRRSRSGANSAGAELTATGEHVRTTGANTIGGTDPQELQVSMMLAEGRTTREAAAALFLSPKTVEYHLRKVYTKLGIGSRGELAELLSRAGQLDRRGQDVAHAETV